MLIKQLQKDASSSGSGWAKEFWAVDFLRISELPRISTIASIPRILQFVCICGFLEFPTYADFAYRISRVPLIHLPNLLRSTMLASEFNARIGVFTSQGVGVGVHKSIFTLN